MRFSISFVQDVLGECCHATFLAGRRSITTSVLGGCDGTWERMNHKLHPWVRVIENRDASPSATILDSQSVKTATPAAIAVGYDAAKQVKGCKRHLLVDTLG